MSSTHGPMAHVEAERMHQEGLQVAENLNQTITAMVTELGRGKGLVMKEPVLAVVYRDRTSGDHCYALWQLMRDRGQFLVKVELRSDQAFSHLYLKVYMQSRFWDKEAQRFGVALSNAVGLQVDIERTQTDGLVTYSATHMPG
jgi:hypothetical protein